MNNITGNSFILVISGFSISNLRRAQFIIRYASTWYSKKKNKKKHKLIKEFLPSPWTISFMMYWSLSIFVSNNVKKQQDYYPKFKNIRLFEMMVKAYAAKSWLLLVQIKLSNANPNRYMQSLKVFLKTD